MYIFIHFVVCVFAAAYELIYILNTNAVLNFVNEVRMQ